MRPVDDRREVEAALTHHYGVPPHAVDDLRFYETTGDRLYVADAEAPAIDGPTAGTRVERVGMYLGSWTEHGLRLGVDGAELLADAAEPVFEVSEADARAWLAGEDLPLHATHETYVPRFLILTHDEAVLGCGLALEGTVQNRVPKERRIPRDAIVLED